MKKFKEFINTQAERSRARLGRVKVDLPKRGFSVNLGLIQTKWMIRLEGDKIWRRVYERWDSKTHKGYIPIVKVKGNEYRDLTPEEKILIEYDPKYARFITPEDREENNTFSWLR